mmetsp:Transcript_3990/g.8655  ORF Transcript_3990/g.8655 Transcript_3990/m.8655 type:complete len:422 (+) Transcript_3990:164-1429(+)
MRHSSLSAVKQYRTICLFLCNKRIDDGVQQDSPNADGASEQLDGVEGFSENKGDTDNDNNTLGGVGNGLRDGSGFLQSEGGAFVVSVEPETGRYEVLPDGGGGLGGFNEFTESASLSDGNNGDRQKKSEDSGDGELVADGSQAVLQTGGFHELLVLVTLDGSEHVSDAGGDESGPGKVEFLHGSQDNTSDDNGKAQPLGLGNGLSVNKLGKDGGKGGFGRLDDLGKGDGSHSHGKDGSGVGSHEAEGNGDHLDQILHGNGGLGSGIGGEPEEDSVDGTNSELEGRKGHRESDLSSGGVQGKLVGDVVVVVTEVPKGKVGDEAEIGPTLFGRSGIGGTSTDRHGIGGIVQAYGGRDAVSFDINGLDQSGLLEGADRLTGSSKSLGSSVEAKGRGGCGKDGDECEGADLHGCFTVLDRFLVTR